MSDAESHSLKKVITRAAGSLLVVLVVQSCALLWWGGRMSARMEHAEEGLFDVAQRVHALEVGSHD